MPSPFGLDEILVAARIVVAVHVADDVGCRVGVAARIRPLRLVIQTGGPQRVAVLAEGDGGQFGVVAVRRENADLVADGLLGQLPGRLALRTGEVGVDDTHRQAQFHRVGEFAPLLGTAFVNRVGRSRDGLAAVRRQHLDRFVQLVEHLPVNVGLRVVGNLNLTADSDFRVGNRAVSVRYAVHGADFRDFGDGEHDRVLRNAVQFHQVAVKHRDDAVAVHEHARPVVRRVVIGDGRLPTVLRVGEITALRTTQQGVGELRRIDVGRNDRSEDGIEVGADGIAFPLHLLFGDLVGVAVYFEVIAGARCPAACEGQDKYRFDNCIFHNGCSFRI